MNPQEIIQRESKIKEQESNVQKVEALNELAFEIRNTDTPRSILLSKEAQEISSTIRYVLGKATALNNEAFCYVQITDYDLALEKLLAALELFEKEKCELGIAQVHYNFCILYFRLGDFNNALDSINKAINFYQKKDNKDEMARCYFQMGLLYHNLKDIESAIEYHNLSIELSKHSSLLAVEAAAKMGLGQVYLTQKEYEKSCDLLLESLAIREQIKDMRGYSAALNAQMNLCFEMGNFEEAEKVSNKGIVLAGELGDKMGIARFTLNLAKIYFKENKAELAQTKAFEALEIAENINLKMVITPAHFLLSEIFQSSGDFEQALYHFQNYYNSNKEALDTNASMKAKSIQFQSKIENSLKEAEINRLKNVELKNAFDEIEEKNREITASITYALRIQTAILPSSKIVKEYLEESFILYKPKDIVAGDFYWLESVNDTILFAACDCTGHGVPGAMVSVVCHNALNRAVREFGLTEPAKILDKTAEIVIEHFSKSEQDIKDGMDVSLCAYNPKKGSLEWAGANNPLWLVRNGEILETKGNKQPIGVHENYLPFTNHSIELKSGDSIYLFTDGFADQFGGETGQKKLGKKGFKDVLLELQDKAMEEQKNALEKFHLKYRKEEEQIDDVLVIGVRV